MPFPASAWNVDSPLGMTAAKPEHGEPCAADGDGAGTLRAAFPARVTSSAFAKRRDPVASWHSHWVSSSSTLQSFHVSAAHVQCERTGAALATADGALDGTGDAEDGALTSAATVAESLVAIGGEGRASLGAWRLRVTAHAPIAKAAIDTPTTRTMGRRRDGGAPR